MIRVGGNTQGLAAQPLRRLERLAQRRCPAEVVVNPELARTMTELANDVQRQVGVLIDRRGYIRHVVIGDARAVFLPDLTDYRTARDRLCGLRLVHTHLNGEPLSDDDLTDLALLRLDMVAAVEVLPDGLPGRVDMAHLLPVNAAEQPWELSSARSVHDVPSDFLDMVDALEEEFGRQRQGRPANDRRDRAIVVHVSTEPHSRAEDSVAELRELARSAGIVVVDTIIQRREMDPRYVMGKGRLQTAIIRAMQYGAEALLFDQTLTPAQVNALAEYTDLKVLDRTQVILDIFAQRAQTREGKNQVELAQLRYMLPRLGAKQTASAFSRLTGGIGGRGPGETKLEIDRRRAKDRIARLEREISKLGDRRKLRRSVRTEKNVPIVSIVGYTNAGKSTLLNNLTRSEVVAENALFATLNPVSRRLRFPKEREIVITDTVGFIRNLPPELLAAFRTTLEELDEADLLLHVVDASSPVMDEQRAVVMGLLKDLELDTKPQILVLNKADLCDPVELEGMAKRLNGVRISAIRTESFSDLMAAIEQCLWVDLET
ncbi:MAG: GTPase HflX [Candidatus Hydrogenedentes bacterium]|nr:GTPase HflX [Candidatus Hydrogenedentota bacterium]